MHLQVVVESSSLPAMSSQKTHPYAIIDPFGDIAGLCLRDGEFRYAVYRRKWNAHQALGEAGSPEGYTVINRWEIDQRAGRGNSSND